MSPLFGQLKTSGMDWRRLTDCWVVPWWDQ